VSSRCAPGSGELLAKRAIELLWELKQNWSLYQSCE